MATSLPDHYPGRAVPTAPSSRPRPTHRGHAHFDGLDIDPMNDNAEGDDPSRSALRRLVNACLLDDRARRALLALRRGTEAWADLAALHLARPERFGPQKATQRRMRFRRRARRRGR